MPGCFNVSVPVRGIDPKSQVRLGQISVFLAEGVGQEAGRGSLNPLEALAKRQHTPRGPTGARPVSAPYSCNSVYLTLLHHPGSTHGLQGSRERKAALRRVSRTGLVPRAP